MFKSLEFRCVGPHRGGRVVAVAGHPTERATFYFGACAGGVWKTTSGGALWENISDGYFKTSAIGAIAVSDSEPNVIYVGTGETAIRSNVSHGDGVYKSTDGGVTWANVGLAETRAIGDIAIHPTNPDIVYVAALGHVWGKNPERGVYRSTDGGKNWELVLHKSDRAGSADISMDPNNPRIIYASIWQAQRYPHMLDSGGEDCGIWKTTDGGDTWTEITRNPGLPTGVLGKIGVAVSPARANRVWALVEAEDGALFRSDDGGATWQRLCDDAALRRRPWYYMHIHGDPTDPDTVWVLNLGFHKSIDGGKTFEVIPTPHGDNHGLWIDPSDHDRMIEGNDGGACVSYDGGRSWSTILNQPTAQFYHVTTDNRTPYMIYGSQQDNWAMRLPMIDFEGAISWKNYTEPGGGESGHIAVSPKPPHKVFGGGIGTGLGHGRLICWNPETGQKRNVTVWPEMHGFGAGAIEHKYRFQWTFPVEFSPHDPDVLYTTSNVVHRSTDEGDSWEVISPDLTRNDPDKIQSSGGAITADNSGAEIYCTIFAFRESPHEKGVFWAGSDDGLVHISRDGGTSWTNITPTQLGEWGQIMIIEPSPHDPATCYIAATRYKHDDNRPFLFKTTNYGESWSLITNGIPDDEFTRTIREDPVRKGLLFTGTETGIWVSFDDGGNWVRLESNLPVTPIHDFVIKDADLVVATHGRSFWILDDITPLRQMQDDLASQPVHLFQPRDTTRWRVHRRAFSRTPGITNYMMTGPVTVAYNLVDTPMGTKTEQFLDAGKNPPDGVVIHYWFDAKPEGEVSLAILDADGAEVRRFSSIGEDTPRVPAEAGMNRFIWDMRYPTATRLMEGGKPDIFASFMDDMIAPRALPGAYQVRLTIGEESWTQPFNLVMDPRIGTTQEQLAEQFNLKIAIRDQISALHESVNRIRRVRTQVAAWEERAKTAENNDVAEAAAALKEKLAAIEDRMVVVDGSKPKPGPSRLKEKLAGLSGMIDESDDPPTQGAGEVFNLLGERVDVERINLERVIGDDLQAFNDLVNRSGLAPVAP